MSNSAYEFTKVDLINHSIKPANLDLLSFFYPDFKIIEDNPMIINTPVIYKGSPEYLIRVKEFGYPVISVTTLGEFDLSSNRTLVNMTFTKWNKIPSARLCKYVDNIDYDELLHYVKIHWVTGRWTMKKYNKNGPFMKIAEAFNEDTPSLLTTYIDLLNNNITTGAYMESSLLSFVDKIASGAKVNTFWYTKILRQYRRGKKQLLKQGIEKYIRSNIWNKDLKVFNLLQDLNRIDKTWTPD